MSTHIHLTGVHIETAIVRVIIDRQVEITEAHRAAALAHLQRHFRIKGVAELENFETLKEALSACGIETGINCENNVYALSINPAAPLAAHALKALHDIAPYVTPGGHLLAVTAAHKLISLKFENAEIRSPLTHPEKPDRLYTNDEVDAVAALTALARKRAATRHHDLGYFQLVQEISSTNIFGEAKCRYCYSSAWFRHTMTEPAGRALTQDCTACPAQGEYVIQQDYPYEP